MALGSVTGFSSEVIQNGIVLDISRDVMLRKVRGYVLLFDEIVSFTHLFSKFWRDPRGFSRAFTRLDLSGARLSTTLENSLH